MISLAVVVLPCCYAQNTQQDYHRIHNSARADVNVSSLVWSEELAREAQWIHAVNIAYNCRPNSQGSRAGVSFQVGNNITGLKAVFLWVVLKGNYDYNTNSCLGRPCTLYVQAVSNNTAKVGCFQGPCITFYPSSLTAVVCRYDPPTLYPIARPY